MKCLRYLSVVIAIVLFSACNPSQIMTLNKNQGLWKSQNISDYQFTFRVYAAGRMYLPNDEIIEVEEINVFDALANSSIVTNENKSDFFTYSGMRITVKNGGLSDIKMFDDFNGEFEASDIKQPHDFAYLVQRMISELAKDIYSLTPEELEQHRKILSGSDHVPFLSFWDNDSDIARIAGLIFPLTAAEAEAFAEQYQLNEEELTGLKRYLRLRKVMSAAFSMDAQFSALYALMTLPSEGGGQVADISYHPELGYPSSYILRDLFYDGADGIKRSMRIRFAVEDFEILSNGSASSEGAE